MKKWKNTDKLKRRYVTLSIYFTSQEALTRTLANTAFA